MMCLRYAAIALVIMSWDHVLVIAEDRTPQVANEAEDVWALPRRGYLRCVSPDGRWLVYAGLFAEPHDYRDYLVDLKTGEERQLSQMLPRLAKSEEFRSVAFCPASAHQLLVKRNRLSSEGRATGDAWDVLDVASGKSRNVLPYRDEGQFQRTLWLGKKLVVSPEMIGEEPVSLIKMVNPATDQSKALPLAGFLWGAANDTVLVQGDTQAPTKPFLWKELQQRQTYGLLAADRSGSVARAIPFSMCGVPSLSPDGRCIAVVLRFAKTPEKNGLYLFPADAEKPGIRIEGVDSYFNIWALDDGRALVHMSVKQDEEPGDSWDLVLVNPNGTVATLASNVQSPIVVGGHVYYLPRGEQTLKRIAIPGIKAK